MKKPTTTNSAAKRTNVEDLLNRIDFSPENVVDAAAQNPGMFVEAIRYRVETMGARNAAKMSWERVQAEHELLIRKTAKDLGEKMTEGAIESLLLVDEDVTEARHAFDAADESDEFAKLLVEAFRMRRDSLQVVGNLMRSELSLQSAVEAGAGKLAETRRRLKDRFPGN